MESYFEQYETIKSIKTLKHKLWNDLGYNIIPDVAFELLRYFSKFDFLFNPEKVDYSSLDIFTDNGIYVESMIGDIFAELFKSIKSDSLLPIDILEKYSKFFYWRVRVRLIRYYNLPVSILEELTQDCDSEVKAYAELKLEEKKQLKAYEKLKLEQEQLATSFIND